MVQYISKDALVAKIRGYINNAEVYLKYHHNRNDKSVYAFEQEKLVMCELLFSLDTLEVKEVDLEKEIDSQWKDCTPVDEGMGCEFANISIEQFVNIAKHFFELGMTI